MPRKKRKEPRVAQKTGHLIVWDAKSKAWLKYEKNIVKDAPECTCDQPALENAIHYPGCPMLNYWVREFMEFEENWRENRF